MQLNLQGQKCKWIQKFKKTVAFFHSWVVTVCPYMLAVVYPCHSAEPHSQSYWFCWPWFSVCLGHAADWHTSRHHHHHNYYHDTIVNNNKIILIEMWNWGPSFCFLNHICLVSKANIDDRWSKSTRFTIHL